MNTLLFQIRVFVLVVFLLSLSNKVSAQACCSGGVPIGGNFGLGTADNKSLQFLFTYDYNSINTLVDVSTILDDDIRKRTTHSSILEINYGLSHRLSFTTLLPYIKQERAIQAYDGSIDFTSTNGLGDIMFLIKYKLLNSINHPDLTWVIGSGLKLPTGRTDFKNNIGLTLVADMQPGAGSVDGLFWMFFQKSKFVFPNLSILSVTTVKLSGTNNKYNNTQAYQFGDEFQQNIGFNYKLFLKWPFDLFSFIRYRSQSVDLIDNNTFPGSGGSWIYLIPGINLDFNKSLALRISGDIPLYRKLKGTQLTTTYKLTAAIYYRIPAKNKLLINNI